MATAKYIIEFQPREMGKPYEAVVKIEHPAKNYGVPKYHLKDDVSYFVRRWMTENKPNTRITNFRFVSAVKVYTDSEGKTTTTQII